MSTEPDSSTEPAESMHDDAPSSTQLDPGIQLCEARESRQLNRAQVGHRLGLTESAVKNLERNNYDYFPSGVYARGYLKNYAKYMELDVEALAEEYDRYCEENGVASSNTGLSSSPEEVNKNDRLGKLFTFLLLVGIAGGLFWFLNGGG